MNGDDIIMPTVLLDHVHYSHGIYLALAQRKEVVYC